MALQRGAAPLLNLGCLSKAASEPISGAKVPFAIALLAARPSAVSARVVAGKPTHKGHPAVVASPPLSGTRGRMANARKRRGRVIQCATPSP
jgi:hypothetical protein